MRENNWERRVGQVEDMAARGLLGRVLVSADAGWYHVGEPGGGDFLPYDLVFTKFLPEIRRLLGEKAVRQLIVENPAKALGGSRQ
jgi:phosphotriesterase-related protein